MNIQGGREPNSGPETTRVIQVAAGVLGAVVLLGGVFVLGQATRDSSDDVQQMIDTQAKRDKGYYTRQRVKAVIDAKQSVRDTWQKRTRKESQQAREQGQQQGYSSGSAAGFQSGKEQGKQQGQVEGYFEGFDEGTCYDPYTYEYIC